MLATAVSDLATAARERTGRAVESVPATAPATVPATTTPATVTVTVHIDLHGDALPPAALGLFENLRALAGTAGVTVTPANGVPAQPDGPAPSQEPAGRVASLRPRLVRRQLDAVPGAGPSLRIYPASRMVLRDGTPVRLTRREYDLLLFLCEHPRRVFGRGQLLRHVWGYEMVSGERTVDVHVRRLRVKLGERGPVIATIRGVGYRLDDATQVTVATDGE
jgi:hypothetical protein